MKVMIVGIFVALIFVVLNRAHARTLEDLNRAIVTSAYQQGFEAGRKQCYQKENK